MSTTPSSFMYEPDFSEHNEKDASSSKTVAIDEASGESHHEKGCSNLLSVFNVINTCVGLGVIKLPGSIQAAGWVGGLLLLGFSASLALYCMLLYYHALTKNASGKIVSSFEDMGLVTFGRVGQLICWFALYVTLILLLVTILSLFGNALMTLFPPSLSLRSWTAIAATIVTPLALLPSMSEIGWVSGVAVISITMVVAVIVAASIYQATEDSTLPSSSIGPATFVDFTGSVSVFMLAYGCTNTTSNIVSEMERPQDYPKVAYASFSFITTVYIIICVTAYVAYGDDLANSDTVLDAISPDADSPSTAGYILEAAVTVMVACHYLITFAPLGIVSDKALGVAASSSNLPLLPRQVVLRSFGRVVVVWVTAIAAICVPDGKVGPLLDVIASVNSVLTVLVLPIAFYWKSLQQTAVPHPSKMRFYFEIFILVVSVFAMVTGLMSAVRDIQKNW